MLGQIGHDLERCAGRSSPARRRAGAKLEPVGVADEARVELLGLARQDHDQRVARASRRALARRRRQRSTSASEPAHDCARDAATSCGDCARRHASARIRPRARDTLRTSVLRRASLHSLARAVSRARAGGALPASAGRRAQDPGAPGASASRAAIERPSSASGIGAVVADASTRTSDSTRYNAETPRNPASNMKLLTAAAALLELGAEFRLRTGLYGRDRGRTARSARWSRAARATRRSSCGDLLALAQRSSSAGVRAVDEIVVDGSYFDDQILPPALRAAAERDRRRFAPRSARSRSSATPTTLRVRAGAGADAPASVMRALPRLLRARQRARPRSAGGAPNVVAEQRRSGEQLALTRQRQRAARRRAAWATSDASSRRCPTPATA